MPYSTTFSTTTAVIIPGGTHGLGTASLVHELYDSAGNVMQAGSVHVDPATYTVTVALSIASSGRLVLIEAVPAPLTGSGGPSIPAGGGTALPQSYVTVVAATAFLAQRLYTEPWSAADTMTQAQALIWATSLLDTQVRWYGTPTTLTQALAWPMTGQRDHLGRPVPSDVVPADIQHATALYALALLRDEAEAPGAVDIGGIKSRKVGDTTITYHDPQQQTTTQTRPVHQGIPAEVRALLRPYAQMSGGMTVALLRT